MASLAVQSLKHLTLEQIIEVGFDRIPNTEEFYRALVLRMNIDEFMDIYQEFGWTLFVKEVLFMIENEGKPLSIFNTVLFWKRYGNKYVIYSLHGDEFYSSDEQVFNTLDEVIGHAIYVVHQHDNIVTELEEEELSEVTSKIRPILKLMSKKHKNKIEKLYQHLQKGGIIRIHNPMGTLSMYPLSDTLGATLLLNDDKITIIGAAAYLYGTPARVSAVNYANQFIPEDTKLVLAILAYNQKDYKLIKPKYMKSTK